MHTTHHPAHPSDSRCHPCTEDEWGDLEPARSSAQSRKAPRPAPKLTLQHQTENWSGSGAVLWATEPSSQKQQPVSWVQQAAWSNAHLIYLPRTSQHPLCGTGATEVWLFWILHVQWTRTCISKNDTRGHFPDRAVAGAWLAQDGRQQNLLFPTFVSLFQPEAPSQKGISFSQNQSYLSAFCSSAPFTCIHRFAQFWRSEFSDTEIQHLLCSAISSADTGTTSVQVRDQKSAERGQHLQEQLQ